MLSRRSPAGKGRHAAPDPAGEQGAGVERALVWVVAAASALVAAGAPARPTGVDVLDDVLCALVGALAVAAPSRAERWTWLVLGGVAAATARGTVAVAGWVSLAVGLVGAAIGPRRPALGAVTGALAVQALLRQEWGGFHGASVLVGAAALAVAAVSGHRRSTRPARRAQRWVAFGVIGAATAATAAFGVAVLLAGPHLREGATLAEDALRAARAGDSPQAEQQLAAAADALREGRRYTDAWWARPARFVPVVGQHVEVVDVVGDEGLAVAEAGRTTASVGDYRELKFASGQLDLVKVTQLRDPLAEAVSVFRHAGRRIEALDRSWLAGPLDARIDELHHDLLDATEEADVAADVVEVLPAMFGGDGPRRYFVAFLNEAEQRGLGGFLGHYAEIVADGGTVELTRSGSAVELERFSPPGTRSLDGPQEYVDRYAGFSPADHFRDLSFSPHFPFVADAVHQLYPQSGGTPLDGVISVDAHALAGLLQFTGPVEIPGYGVTLSADNAAEMILREQYLLFADANDERKDLLDEATRLVFDRLLQTELPDPERVVDVLGPLVRQRRIMVSSVHPTEQALMERVGLDGAMPGSSADPRDDLDDVFMVAHQNFGNSKIDAYLRRTIEHRTRLDAATGEVEVSVTVTFTNDAPAEGLPRYVIGNTRGRPFGTNLMNLTVYSRHGLRSAEVDGVPLGFSALPEAGTTAYAARLDLPPRSTRTLTMTFVGAVDLSDADYTAVLVPQPSVDPDQLVATVEVEEGTVRRAAGGTVSADGTGARWRPPAFEEPVTARVRLDGAAG